MAQRFPGTHHLPHPASPLLFYLRICCQNSNELSILWPRHFPTEASSLADSGSSRNSERKEESKRILFNFFFFMFHSFLSLCPPGLLPSSAPSLPQPPLLPFTPFMLQDRSNWSSGGSYRECIGSLGEKSPQQAIHQMYNVIWSNWQTQKLKNKKAWIRERHSKACFQNSPAKSPDSPPETKCLKEKVLKKERKRKKKKPIFSN